MVGQDYPGLYCEKCGIMRKPRGPAPQGGNGPLLVCSQLPNLTCLLSVRTSSVGSLPFFGADPSAANGVCTSLPEESGS